MGQKSVLKVAVAGTGNVAQYLFEELEAYGHELVILTRTKKPNLARYEQRETDYSISSLVKVLEDCNALVSTVSDYSDPGKAIQAHKDMLEAIIQSKKCKTFIPSEWTLNVEQYPEQPMFLGDANLKLYQRLSQAKGIKWTIFCNSWFADYVLPSRQRHLRDVGGLFPGNVESKQFTIYGPGTQLVDLTAVRDVAKAVAALLGSDELWEDYTYVSGGQTTWNELFAILKRRDPQWTSRNKPLADTINQIIANESPESVLEAHFEVEGYAGALAFPPEKVQRHRNKYFSNIHFRSIEDLLDESAATSGTIA